MTDRNAQASSAAAVSSTSSSSSSMSPMRKVFSLDCVRRIPRNRSGRQRCQHFPVGPDTGNIPIAREASVVGPQSKSADVPSCKASKFSSTAHRRKLLDMDSSSLHDRPKQGDTYASRPSLSSSSSMRRSSSRAHVHHVVDPIIDVVTGGTAEDDDEDGVDDLDLVDGDDSGLLSAITSILRGGKRRSTSFVNISILLLLFLGTFAKKSQNGRLATGHGGHGGGGTSLLSHRRSSDGGGALGSAMLQSVTTALSPILPFAGGVDLRRGEHWGLDEDYYPINASSGWFWPASLWHDSNRDSTLSSSSSSSGYFGSSAPSDVATSVPRGGAQSGPTSSSSSSSRAKRKPTRSRSGATREPVLAAPVPFISTDEISQLTLGDVALVFQYAVESGTDGFDSVEFFQSSANDDGEPLSERMVTLISAMDEAVAKSRGDGVLEASTRPRLDETDSSSLLSPEAGYGDVDALKFCAAMRLLAEWRVLRQVPDGYKGYAVGMSLGHKDVVQNIIKIEASIHDLIELRKQEYEAALDEMGQAWDEASCRAGGDNTEPTCEAERSEKTAMPTSPSFPRSPTLRELLQYEIDEEIQNIAKLPRLKEKSAGMGLLWVRRQLHYQTEIFANVLLVPDVFRSATDAVAAAYAAVYDRFHGWAVQKIFNYSFQAAPDADVIFRHMNPSKLEEVTAAALNGAVQGVGGDNNPQASIDDFIYSSTTEETADTESLLVFDEELNQTPFYSLPALNESNFVEDWAAAEDEESGNPWVRFGLHIVSEWDKFSGHIEGELDKLGKHIEGEWDKVASGIVRLFQGDGQERQQQSTDVRGGGRRATLSGEALERYLSSKMEEDAKNHIARYLEVVSPLLDDIAGLFEEMNCDDPTKV